MTRKPISQKDFVPNTKLKEAVADYLDDNPWTYPDDEQAR
eukprot:gene12051-20308_t